MRRFIVGVSAFALCSTGVIACSQVFADDGNGLSMTIYGDNRALVEDVRDFRFENGRSTVVLPNVSSQINAPSATFIADGIEILEQNFDYDLLSPNKLMQKAVGQEVEIIRTNPGTG